MSDRYVVLSANNHPDYQFLLPLTAILWAERTSYKPLVLTSRVTETLAMLRDSGTIRLEVVEHHNDRLYPKLARWYAYRYFTVRDDVTQFLLSDVDLWPIDGKWYDRPAKKAVTLFYADAYQYEMHATCHVRGTPRAFNEITKGGNASTRIEEIRKLPDDWDGRHSDDCAQSELLMAWKGYKDECEMVERGESPPKTRIDRSNWPSRFDLDGMIDAHLPRDASDGRVWRLIEPLFAKLAPSWAGWARCYRKAWERDGA